MNSSEYFRDNVVKYLAVLSDRALNAGTYVVETIIVFDTARPFTAKDYQHALAAWLQARNDVRQRRIYAYKADPTEENLAVIAELAIHEHTPHTQQDYDDIV